MPRFDAEQTVMGFDPAISKEAMPQASPLTAQVSEQYCRQLLQRRHAWSGVKGRVRQLILRDPRTPLSQDAAARALGVSVRTLRRQLDEEATNFRAVVAHTNQHLAEELLRAGFSVDQVADRLGYSEATSFTHAFTRWTGIPPGRWARDNPNR
jgi:AraC-like DNA-binding protein